MFYEVTCSYHISDLSGLPVKWINISRSDNIQGNGSTSQVTANCIILPNKVKKKLKEHE